jgi:hypothetical protein
VTFASQERLFSAQLVLKPKQYSSVNSGSNFCPSFDAPRKIQERTDKLSQLIMLLSCGEVYEVDSNTEWN